MMRDPIGVSKVINVLIAEDNEVERMIAVKVLEKSKLKCNIFSVEDGEQLLQFILREGEYEDKEKYPRPDVVICDLGLPKKTGLEVMEHLNKDPFLKDIPFIVLTGSDDEKDVGRSYDFGASSFIRKPVTYESLLKAIGGIFFYLNKLPDGQME